MIRAVRRLLFSILIGAVLLLVASLCLLVWAVRHRTELARRVLAAVSAKTGIDIKFSQFDAGLSTRGINVSVDQVSFTYKGISYRVDRVEVLASYGGLVHDRVLPLKSVTLIRPVIEITTAKEQPQSSHDLEQELDSYLLRVRTVCGQAARFLQTAHIVHGRIILGDLTQSDGSVPKVDLDGAISASAKTVNVEIERLIWNGPSVSGLSISAKLAIEASDSQSDKPIRLSAEFSRAGAVGFAGHLGLSLARTFQFDGGTTFEISNLPKIGSVMVDASYAMSQAALDLKATVKAPPAVGVSRDIKVTALLANPFSIDPAFSLVLGGFALDLEAMGRAFGAGVFSAVHGSIAVRRAQWGFRVKSLREALVRCADTSCAIAAAAKTSNLSVEIAAADLENERFPRAVSHFRLRRPVEIRVDKDGLQAVSLEAQLGSIQLTEGRFRGNLSGASGKELPDIEMFVETFVKLDVSDPDIKLMLPEKLRPLLLSSTPLYVQISSGGRLHTDERGYQLTRSWLELRRGFLGINKKGNANGVNFSGRASDDNKKLDFTLHASTLGGTRIDTNGSFVHSTRTVRAFSRLNGVNLEQLLLMVGDGSSFSDVKVSGKAKGRIALVWALERDIPTIDGSIEVSNLSVASPFTSGPALVRTVTLTVDRFRAQAALSNVIVGAGDFDVRVEVPDLQRPAVSFVVSGKSFDLAAFKPALAHGASTERSKPFHASAHDGSGVKEGTAKQGSTWIPPLAGTVAVNKVFFENVELTDVRGELDYKNDDWIVKNFHANGFKGSVDISGMWQASGRMLYLSGAARTLDARALFMAMGWKDKPPISGELSLAVNAGVEFEGGGKQPVLSCGGATIAVSNGSLGKADFLVRLIQLVNLESWIKLRPPDLDTVGLPFDKLYTELSFSKPEITVDNLLLVGPVIRVTGHGVVKMPENAIQLHLRAMPFTTSRWLLHFTPLISTQLVKFFDKVFSVDILVSGTPKSLDVSPDLFGSVVSALVGVIELPLDLIPEDLVPDALSLKPVADLSKAVRCEEPENLPHKALPHLKPAK